MPPEAGSNVACYATDSSQSAVSNLDFELSIDLRILKYVSGVRTENRCSNATLMAVYITASLRLDKLI